MSRVVLMFVPYTVHLPSVLFSLLYMNLLSVHQLLKMFRVLLKRDENNKLSVVCLVFHIFCPRIPTLYARAQRFTSLQNS